MLDDWGDLSPGVIVIADDVPPVGAYSPAIVGPDASSSTGEMSNAIKGRLRVGVLSDYIVLDPASPLRMSMYDNATEVLRVGNLNGFLGYGTDVYGVAIGDEDNYLKYDAVNGLRIKGALGASTIDIGGEDTSSFHVDVAGNMWLGAATFAAAPFSVSKEGVIISTDASSLIEQAYTSPGDDNTTPGSGFKLTNGTIEAYGGDQTFGGTIVSSNGGYLVSIGKFLTANGLTKRYPLNNAINFTVDGRIHMYFWDTVPTVDTWAEIAHLGDATGSYGSYTIANFDAKGHTNVSAVVGQSDSFNIPAIYGIDDNITGGIGVEGSSGAGYGLMGQGGKSPLWLYPAATSAAPSHVAMKGSLWVTSAGAMYINIDGATTWVAFTTGSGGAITGVVSDSFTINSDLTDANADLVLGRTTGGSARLRWDGTDLSMNKNVVVLSGASYSYIYYAIGRTSVEGYIGVAASAGNWATGSAPGDIAFMALGGALHLTTTSGGYPALTVPAGTTNVKVLGAFGCNAANPQTAYASGGALAAYGAGANGFDSGANASALHAMVVAIRAALVASGIMS
jgi:hypothetical protein